jgi:hypothetical protein
MVQRVPSATRRGFHAVARAYLLAVVGVAAVAGCGGGRESRAAAPSSEAGGETAEAAALVRLHEAVRAPGLDHRRFSPDDFHDAIAPYLADGPFQVDVIGTSAEGRPIRRIRYGSGPVRVLLWSQMHGDESTATMALADILRFLAERPDHPLARRIADGATVHMVPMLNPDGAARFQRRNAQGVDVNRDARRLETPEGRTLKRVRDEVRPDFGFNLHDQDVAVRVGGSDRPVAIALLAPAFNAARDVDEKRARAMRVASALVEVLDPLVGGHIARYDDTFNPRAFGDLMGAWGASTVLIESGGWPDDPQKQHLRRANFVGVLRALDLIATGELDRYDPDVYRALPENGRRPPHLLIAGGRLAVPSLEPIRADIFVDFDRPLLRTGGTIRDVGDLDGFDALDTLRIDGLYLVPGPAALDDHGGLALGAPAEFVVAEDPAGRRVRFRFEGGPPPAR